MKIIKSFLSNVVIVFGVAFIAASMVCKAQSAPRKALLALSKANHTLAIVDAEKLNVVARIPVGEDPHEIISSSDGKTAYVSIYGGGSLHELNVIDLMSQKPSLNVDTRPLFGPHGITFVNGKVWFSAEGSKAVGRYDPIANKLDWSMGTGEDRTHMIYVTANGKRIYTTNVSSGTVSILVDTLISFMPPPGMKPPVGNSPPSFARPRANWNQTIVKTARGAEGFDVSPDSTELWTASAEDGFIYVINLKSKKLTDKIDAKVLGANRLKFTPNGKLAFISSLRSGTLFIYDVKSHKEVKQLNIGHGASGIVMDPDGSRAFVACTPDNYVAVIDLKTLEVIHRIDVRQEPDGLAWAIRL